MKVPRTAHGRKRPGQSLIVTNATGQQVGCLLYVTDRESRLRFLVNTGTEVSIVPPLELKEKIDRIQLACSQQTVHQ